MEVETTSGGLAVAIVTRETDRDFEECMKCTETQTLAPSEVIVVTGSMIQGYEAKWPHARFMISAANRSAARNLAWRTARSDTICYWEADSLFSDNWIEEVMKEFSVGADAVIDRRRCYRPKTYFQKCWDKQFDIRYSHYKPFSAWAFRREVLRQTGGYDEELEYAEDSDLGSRILNQGFSIRLAEKAVQYHKGEPKDFTDVVKRRYLFGRKKALGYYRKHPNELPLMKITASVLGPAGLIYLAIAGFPFLATALMLASPTLISGWIYLSCWSRLSPADAYGIALARILGGTAYQWGVLIGLLARRFQLWGNEREMIG